MWSLKILFYMVIAAKPVSYTHLDVYKRQGLAGGKMLTRINYADAGTVATLQASARAIDELAERKLMAMVEPFISVGSAENVRLSLIHISRGKTIGRLYCHLDG